MWAWIGLIWLWSFVGMLVFAHAKNELLTQILVYIMVASVIAALLLGSVELLRYTQAWPFNPQ
jgi:hypothetical protein